MRYGPKTKKGNQKCNMGVSMEKDMFGILKSKHWFHAHKTICSNIAKLSKFYYDHLASYILSNICEVQNSIFFAVQPCMEQISAKYSLPSLSSNKYFVRFFITDIHLVFNILITLCPFPYQIATDSFVILLASLSAINSRPNMSKKWKCMFNILSATIELPENEYESLYFVNFPFS